MVRNPVQGISFNEFFLLYEPKIDANQPAASSNSATATTIRLRSPHLVISCNAA